RPEDGPAPPTRNADREVHEADTDEDTSDDDGIEPVRIDADRVAVREVVATDLETGFPRERVPSAQREQEQREREARVGGAGGHAPSARARIARALPSSRTRPWSRSSPPSSSQANQRRSCDSSGASVSAASAGARTR